MGETHRMGRRIEWGDASNGETHRMGRRIKWGDARSARLHGLGETLFWAQKKPVHGLEPWTCALRMRRSTN